MVRKDNKGRNLKTGEYQRQDGRSEYRYTDPGTGKKNAVYETDLKKLRELEKDVQRDIDDGIAIKRKMTVLNNNVVVKTLFRFISTQNPQAA